MAPTHQMSGKIWGNATDDTKQSVYIETFADLRTSLTDMPGAGQPLKEIEHGTANSLSHDTSAEEVPFAVYIPEGRWERDP